jgi:uncharacterized membrane protein YccF (DUF307 family)
MTIPQTEHVLPTTHAARTEDAPHLVVQGSPTVAEALAVPASAPTHTAAPHVVVNVNMATPSTNVIIMNQGNGSPGFLIRAIWFLFVGWWLSFWWISLAWLLNLTIIGLPVGLMMLNRVPTVLTLQGQKKQLSVTQHDGVTLIQNTDVAQLPMWLRASYFVLIGSWASLAFAMIAWGLSVLILTLPIGLIMFNFLPQVTTLRRT